MWLAGLIVSATGKNEVVMFPKISPRASLAPLVSLMA
jgi:hypothetical protein